MGFSFTLWACLLSVSLVAYNQANHAKALSEDPLCEADDIAIKRTGNTVQILNQCDQECAIENIRVSCPGFDPFKCSAASPVFRQVSPGICLANDGLALMTEDSIEFTYTGTTSFSLLSAEPKC